MADVGSRRGWALNQQVIVVLRASIVRLTTWNCERVELEGHRYDRAEDVVLKPSWLDRGVEVEIGTTKIVD